MRFQWSLSLRSLSIGGLGLISPFYYSDANYQPRREVVSGKLDRQIILKLNTNTSYGLLEVLRLDEFERLFVLAANEFVFLTIFETKLFGQVIRDRRNVLRGGRSVHRSGELSRA